MVCRSLLPFSFSHLSAVQYSVVIKPPESGGVYVCVCLVCVCVCVCVCECVFVCVYGVIEIEKKSEWPQATHTHTRTRTHIRTASAPKSCEYRMPSLALSSATAYTIAAKCTLSPTRRFPT